MTKIITLANQKGGATKTTTAVNLAAGYGLADKSVLIIDTDLQCNTTASLMKGVTTRNLKQITPSIADILLDNGDKIPVQKAIRSRTREENVHLIPSNEEMDGIEMELKNDPMWGFALSRRREEIEALGYDYVIIDTPPGGTYLRTVCIYASDLVIIPVASSEYSLQGTGDILEQLSVLKNSTGRNIPFRVLQTRANYYDGNMRKAPQDFRRQLQELFSGHLLQTVIPEDQERIYNAEKFAKSILRHAPASASAEGYRQLLLEVYKL